MMQLKIPPPEPRGRHLPPETIHPLKGKPETGINASGMIHSQVPGLGPQVPGSGVLVQGQVQDPNPYPNLITRTRYPTAET